VIPIKDNMPTEGAPWVTLALILANVVVYVVASAHGGSLIKGPDPHELVTYGVTPYALTHGAGLAAWKTIFTSMFMHASIVQIIGNMAFLWWFGNNVEAAMGPTKFLGFYLLGGVISLAVQVALGPKSTASTVGAAGAVAAVIGGHLVLYPRAKILTLVLIPFFFGVIETPVLVMLGAWVVMQAVFAAVGLIDPVGSTGAPAYFTYAGGLVFGALSVRLLASNRTLVAA
jgi:membrane associated rhomboid family serine protease